MAVGSYGVSWWSFYDADGEYACGLQRTYDEVPGDEYVGATPDEGSGSRLPVPGRGVVGVKRTGPTQAVRDSVFARDRACIVCGGSDYLQVHHRRARGMGGTRRAETNDAANLVLVCLEHHAWIESNREVALDRGLLVPQAGDPASVPLIRHGAWVFLTDDGRVLDCRSPWDEACIDGVPCADCPRAS